MKELAKLLSSDEHLVVNRTIAKEVGLTEAVLLAELCAQYNYAENNGELKDDSFCITREQIYENTGMTDYQQREAMKTLQDLGFLSISRKGVPAKNHYSLDFSKMFSFLTSRGEKTSHQDVRLTRARIDTYITSKDSNIASTDSNKVLCTTSKEVVGLCKTDDFTFGITPAKEKKKSLYEKCVNLIDETFNGIDAKLRSKLIEYLRFRLGVKDKPMFANQWKGMLNNLLQIESSGQGSFLEIVEQSIKKSYLNFYPVSNGNGKKFNEYKTVSSQYTEDELAEIERLTKEREAKGERAHF